VIGTNDAGLGPANKTSLVMTGDDRPGSLFRSLKPLADRGINLTKLESRPRRGSPFEYVFYIDLDGSAEDEHVAAALDEVRLHTSMLKVLGSYPASKGPV
jgi:chorismate mutase/prephenate dehydratase